MNRVVKQLLIWTVALTCVVALNVYVGGRSSDTKGQTIGYTDLLGMVENGRIKDVTITGQTLVGRDANHGVYRTTIPGDAGPMYAKLREHGVNIAFQDQQSKYWVSILISILPFPLLLAGPLFVLLVVLLFRRRRSLPPASA
ncbi:MAG TPA: ATP-dependent metallopeptidase FtsH/Yme1/Tma family protein [Acidobacteriaceae bacterium]|jgi:cell division protease FtsH